MSGNSTPPTPDSAQDDRLESWKEIAAYLRREVRTVQRWEKGEDLPIHRHLHDKLGSVYAFKSELDAWWVSRRAEVENDDAAMEESAAEEIDSVPPQSSAPAAADAAAATPAAQSPTAAPIRQSLKPKELVRHPVKSLRRPIGVPLGILLVIVALGVYLIWPSPPVHGGRLMIAVLPFENMSGDAEQEYLSDGLTEEMISQLGRLNPESLGVIARQSSMQQKHSKKSLREIGHDLQVSYVMTGSVRLSKGDPADPADDRVRITANLSEVNSNTQVWSESYDRHMSDVLDLQSEVAQAIASAIRVKFTPQSRARGTTAAIVNPEAYQNYLKGRYQLNGRDLNSMQHGLDYFGRAIAVDPGFALAYVGIADTYDLLGFYSALPPSEAYPEGKKAAQKALSLDDSLAEAYTTLADVQLHHDYDWQGAEQGFRRAIALNPNYSVAHHWYGVLLALSGRSAESLTQIDQALKLDPASLAITGDVSLHYFYAGQYDQTIEQSRKCLELDPSYHMCHFWLARAFVEKKMYDQGIAEFRKAIELQPENLMSVALMGDAYARAGQPARAREALRNLQHLSTKRYVGASLFAIVYCGLGEKDKAFEYIERGFQQRDPLLTRMKLDPVTLPIRSDPRFAELLRRVGFPQ
jgi:TolB-like protein/Flp pilus assembly protein TadD